MFDDCIIMAGGSGTRLWPASNSRFPKQFLTGPGGKSFFHAALERGLAITSSPDSKSAGGKAGRVIIIAGKGHVPHVLNTCAQFSLAEKGRMVLICEPIARNTAPAIACGASYAERSGGGSRKILVLTSDHVINPLEAFRRDAETAAAFLDVEDSLVVFGIPPSRPDTGYGYIETAERLNTVLDAAAGGGVYRAASFREKPDRERAEQFLQAGNFFWNSGMFAFNSSFILAEFRRSEHEALSPFEGLSIPGKEAYEVKQGIGVLENWPGLEEAYRAVKAVSIDYGIAEKCRSVAMVAAGFNWFDVGSWDEYAKLRETARGAGPELYAVPEKASASVFVDADIPVALCGVEDLVVVIRSGKDGRPAAALIAKKGETQKVKDIVEQIKAKGHTELL
ncbi:MAG: mannose-1-phosphate guanylyltransferase [Treponema sp.]|nr:mannose-1-phosphate guanylyltransferase [Treponema sp.]